MTAPDPEAAKVLSDLSRAISQGTISTDQVLELLPKVEQKTTTSDQKVSTPHTKLNLQTFLYFLGAIIILTGITVLIYQYWSDMSQTLKMLLTGTFAISAYSAGCYFFAKETKKDLGHAFFTISAAIFPLAIGTTLDNVGIHATKTSGAVINSAALTTIFLTSYSSLKALIFLPFSIAAATALYLSSVHYILMGASKPPHFAEFEALSVGLSYLFLGYYLKKDSRMIMNTLYFFGSIFILSSTMSLAGFGTSHNLLWEAAYPFILSAMFAVSIKIQSKMLLVMTTIFTFGEIMKITAQYFARSIGWPIALMFAGLIIMGIGYASFEINKRYLKQPAQS